MEEWVSKLLCQKVMEKLSVKNGDYLVLLIKNGYVIIAVWCRGGCNKTGGWKGATISAKLTAPWLPTDYLFAKIHQVKLPIMWIYRYR